VSPFNSESFPESLAIATDEYFTIGSMDDIQKLHIRTIALGEMPRRIAHQESSETFCVLTAKTDRNDVGEQVDTYFVKLIDQQTFEGCLFLLSRIFLQINQSFF